MENKIVFRNHISTILEGTVRAVAIIFFAFIGNFLSNAEESGSIEDTLIFAIVMLAAFVVVVGWQVLIWSKTYITIQENTIIVERKTLNYKKNTIGIKNVSNVNLEQNLFEMLLGTCKVKLDTNSLSTADSTDVKIILKKRDAEQFKMLVLGQIQNEIVAAEGEAAKSFAEAKSYVASAADIIGHGIFSVNIVSALVFVGGVFGTIGLFKELINAGSSEGLWDILLTIFVVGWFLLGNFWNLAKGFVQYINFQVERREKQIHINYGLIKKVNYSVPVDKINAVTMNQTMFARIGKRYTVELINVGMGDDENEANSFFLPYSKKEKVEELLALLLPEFETCIQIQEERQPKCVWIIWLIPTIIYLAVMGVGLGAVAELIPEFLAPVIAGVVVMSAYLLVARILSYFTEGSKMQDDFLKLVSGSFGRKIVFIKAEKIQFVTLKQNFLAKKFEVQKGTIHLLAAMKNQIHNLPYFEGKI